MLCCSHCGWMENHNKAPLFNKSLCYWILPDLCTYLLLIFVHSYDFDELIKIMEIKMKAIKESWNTICTLYGSNCHIDLCWGKDLACLLYCGTQLPSQ